MHSFPWPWICCILAFKKWFISFSFPQDLIKFVFKYRCPNLAVEEAEDDEDVTEESEENVKMVSKTVLKFQG